MSNVSLKYVPTIKIYAAITKMYEIQFPGTYKEYTISSCCDSISMEVIGIHGKLPYSLIINDTAAAYLDNIKPFKCHFKRSQKFLLNSSKNFC